jgi:hypothetical protein
MFAMVCLECDRLRRETKAAADELQRLIDESYARVAEPVFEPPSVHPLLIVQARLNEVFYELMQHCADGHHA